VLKRSRFDRYVSREDRIKFLEFLEFKAHFVPIDAEVAIFRDPKDDKFLSLALAGGARFLVTGDSDLSAQDPFGPGRILKPADFLNR
jgi:putative PIN family toxin of toxin-antitoxin system